MFANFQNIAISNEYGMNCSMRHAVSAMISRPISMRRISEVPAPIS
jgi:hypothetical protein